MSARKKDPPTEQAADVVVEPGPDAAERLVVFSVGEHGPELSDTSKTVTQHLVDDPMLPTEPENAPVDATSETEEPEPEETDQ